jgi:ribosomal protein S21
MENKTDTFDPVFEAMLKRFMNDVKKSGVLEEIRRRRYYQKPSELKRLKRKGLLRNGR